MLAAYLASLIQNFSFYNKRTNMTFDVKSHSKAYHPSSYIGANVDICNRVMK